jgi:hypothetical protein
MGKIKAIESLGEILLRNSIILGGRDLLGLNPNGNTKE